MSKSLQHIVREFLTEATTRATACTFKNGILDTKEILQAVSDDSELAQRLSWDQVVALVQSQQKVARKETQAAAKTTRDAAKKAKPGRPKNAKPSTDELRLKRVIDYVTHTHGSKESK